MLDDVTGVIRFLDGTTGSEVAHYPTDLPTIGSTSLLAGSLVVGPQDVLYVNEVSAEPGIALVAYGLVDDSYVEIARVSRDAGTGALTLGRDGVTEAGSGTLIMPYVVAPDGSSSGLQLDVVEPSIKSDGGDAYTVRSGDRIWKVNYVFPDDAGLPQQVTCVLCPTA